MGCEDGMQSSELNVRHFGQIYAHTLLPAKLRNFSPDFRLTAQFDENPSLHVMNRQIFGEKSIHGRMWHVCMRMCML